MRFLRDADAELVAAVAWYEKRREGLGAELLAAIDESLAMVTKRPMLGAGYPLSRDPRLRRVLVSRFPYQLIYFDSAAGLTIVAVAHLRRRPGYWKNRL